MDVLLWIVAGFLAGSVPFSVLMGRWVMHTDIRRYGDGNPGATNVLRAGNKGAAALAAFLDMLKGALPVALAYIVAGKRDYAIVPIALAPLLGHLYSPFLRGRGGKGIAVTGGIWIGLTSGIATALGTTLLTLATVFTPSGGWATMAAMAGIGLYLWVWRRDPVLLTIWAANTVILLLRHRQDLRHPPEWRGWLTRRRVP